MRFTPFLIITCLTSTAYADGTADVGKLVRASLDASIGRKGELAVLLADDHAIIGADGGLTPLGMGCAEKPKASECMSFVPLFGAEWSGKLAYSNVKPFLSVDDKRRIATFFVTADLTGNLAGVAGKLKGTTPMRIAGAARLDKDGWKIIGAKFTGTLPDKELAIHGATYAATLATDPTGKLDKEVRTWFGHLADHQAANAVGVSGTAPEEVATDKASIAKLAKAIDGLTLKPYSSGVIEAGDVAFVYADVTLVSKTRSVDLAVGIALVKEGGVWKWTAIDFGAISVTAHLFR